jgi:aspartate aminotransferase
MLGKYFASANRNIIAQQRASMSAWNKLTAAPADPILGLNEAFKKCTAPEKVLLGMGVYRDNDNKPYILPCVRIAEHRILEKDMDHEYAGIEGIPSFVAKSQALAFGKDHSVIKENRLAGA